MRSESPIENEHMVPEMEEEHIFSPVQLETWTKSLIKIDTSERPESEPCLPPKAKDPTRFITPVRFLMASSSQQGYSSRRHYPQEVLESRWDQMSMTLLHDIMFFYFSSSQWFPWIAVLQQQDGVVFRALSARIIFRSKATVRPEHRRELD